jgi:hypothetical protein
MPLDAPHVLELQPRTTPAPVSTHVRGSGHPSTARKADEDTGVSTYRLATLAGDPPSVTCLSLTSRAWIMFMTLVTSSNARE